MLKRFESYQAGVLDTCRALGVDAPDGMNDGDFDYPKEDDGELDMTEYLRGQMHIVIEYLKNS